jgi:hypothetical protein
MRADHLLNPLTDQQYRCNLLPVMFIAKVDGTSSFIQARGPQFTSSESFNPLATPP